MQGNSTIQGVYYSFKSVHKSGTSSVRVYGIVMFLHAEVSPVSSDLSVPDRIFRGLL